MGHVVKAKDYKSTEAKNSGPRLPISSWYSDNIDQIAEEIVKN